MGISVGVGTTIYNGHQSNILDGVHIGSNCKIHSHVWIGSDIPDNSKVEAFAFIPPGIEFMGKVFIGPHVCFTNDKHPPSGGNWSKTVVGENAVFGANCTILPGITIGKNSVIGAGAVVTKDVPDYATVVGNPAKVLRVDNP